MTVVRRLSHLAGACLLIALTPGLSAHAQAPVPGPQSQDAQARPHFADAQPGDVRVYTSTSLRPAFERVAKQLHAAVGRKVVVEARQARALQDSIASGMPFEAAVLTKPSMEALAKSGHVTKLVDVGDNTLGFQARGDVAKLDVSTPDALKKTLLGAKSIRRFYGAGVTVAPTDHLIKTLGVEEEIQDNLAPQSFGPRTEVVLGPGEYELDISLRSEIGPRPGWTYIGVAPKAVALPNVMTAGVSATAHPEHAEKLIAFLRGPEFKSALAATGLEPL